MKKIILIFVLITASFKLFPQVTQIDSVVIWHCRDNTIVHWLTVDSFDVNRLLINSTSYSDDTLRMPFGQDLYTYSPSFKLLHLISSNYQNANWITSRDQLWQYDIHDSLLSYTNLYYHSGSIFYGYADLYSYDSLNRLSEYIHQKFVDSLNTLINDTRIIYSYDTINNNKIEVHQNYNDSLSTWVNYSKNTFYSNSSGKIIRVISESWIPPGIFSYSSTRSYYYLPNDSLYFISVYYSISGDSTVTQYVYDSSGYTKNVLIGDWSFGTLTEMRDSINYFYDASHNLIASSYYSRDPYSLAICDSSLTIYDSSNRIINYFRTALGFCGSGGESGWNVYNPMGDIDSLNKCSWTMGTLTCSTCSCEYISLTSGVSSINKAININIFPNPARSVLYIEQNHNEIIKSIKVINSIGQENICQHSSINSSQYLQINTSHLAPGVYFLELLTSKQKLVKRFVKE